MRSGKSVWALALGCASLLRIRGERAWTETGLLFTSPRARPPCSEPQPSHLEKRTRSPPSILCTSQLLPKARRFWVTVPLGSI